MIPPTRNTLLGNNWSCNLRQSSNGGSKSVVCWGLTQSVEPSINNLLTLAIVLFLRHYDRDQEERLWLIMIH